MFNQAKLQNVTAAFAVECESLFGEKLRDVRLFGSYARGDYDTESDIDIMVLVDMNETETRKYLDEICRIASEMDLKHGVLFSPILQSNHEYERQKSISGFYKNVAQEGVSIYAR